jgi:hypothetical protein
MKDGRFSDLWRCNTHSQLYRTENYWKAPSDGSERKESPPPHATCRVGVCAAILKHRTGRLQSEKEAW